MNTFDPQLAADRAREAYRKTMAQFELEAPVPDSVRSLAEKTVTQAREVYEHSKNALEMGLDTIERTFDAAGQGATALNRKVIDIAQRNVNAGFELAKDLAAAKTVPEIVQLHSGYWRNQAGTLAAQAGELHTLQTKVAADAIEPIKAYVTRDFN